MSQDSKLTDSDRLESDEELMRRLVVQALEHPTKTDLATPSGSRDDELMRHFVEEALLDEGSAAQSQPMAVEKKGHQPLSPEMQEIVKTGLVRMAGYDAQGEFLGAEQLLRDLETVCAIESTLVIKPEDVVDQLTRFVQARAAGNLSGEQLQRVSSFAAVGGHANLNDVPTLVKLLQRSGYVCLLEFVVDDGTTANVKRRVPAGYIYGFRKSFLRDDDAFPTLGLSAITAPKEKIDDLCSNFGEQITNWRTSTIRDFRQLQKLGIDVPQSLLTAETSAASRLGVATALKLAIVALGKEQRSEHILLNIGSLEEPHESLGYRIPNVASEAHNLPIVHDSGYSREFLTHVFLAELHIANIRWSVHLGLIYEAMNNLLHQDSVLKRKRGWDTDRLCENGRTISHIDEGELAQYAAEALALYSTR